MPAREALRRIANYPARMGDHMLLKHASDLLRNPISLWLTHYLSKLVLQIRHRGKHLHIGYMSRAVECHFGRYNTIYDYVHLVRTRLGDFSYINRGSVVHEATIGSFCSIGADVRIGLGIHPAKTFVSTHPAFYARNKYPQKTFVDQDYFTERASVVIGSDVWVGNGAYIYDGVSVGDGAIVAAGAIVSRNVSPYTIVGGVPARAIRRRFAEEEIDFLLNLRWWEKDTGWLEANAGLFHDVKLFMKTMKNAR